MTGSGTLMAQGRYADVFDMGDGTVLRRVRGDHDCRLEASLISYLFAKGIPVPEVLDAEPGSMRMRKVPGPVMLDVLMRNPWRLRAAGRLMAQLQRQLSATEPPPWLASTTVRRDCVVHGDLHPGNVILAGSGPVLIDWTNASADPAGLDVAHTWVILTCFKPPPPVHLFAGLGSRTLLTSYLSDSFRSSALPWVNQAVQQRLVDANTSDRERRQLTAFAGAVGV